MSKTIGWKKSLFGNHWKSEQGTEIKVARATQGYVVFIKRKGSNSTYKIFKTQKIAIDFAIDYMRNHREDIFYIAKNIIVSIDFDGVLAHGLNAKRKYAKKWFGVDLTLEQTKKEGFDNLMKKLGRYPQINYRSLMDKLNEEHIMEYEVPNGCIRVLKKLYSEGYRFVIITSRNDHDYPYAKSFVKHHFGYLIKNIYNTRNEPKDRFVARLRPRIHMDDDIIKLSQIKHLPVHCFFYRQPENNHVQQLTNLIYSGRAYREIHNWDDFYFACHKIQERQEEVCKRFGIENNIYNSAKIFYKEREL